MRPRPHERLHNLKLMAQSCASRGGILVKPVETTQEADQSEPSGNPASKKSAPTSQILRDQSEPAPEPRVYPAKSGARTVRGRAHWLRLEQTSRGVRASPGHKRNVPRIIRWQLPRPPRTRLINPKNVLKVLDVNSQGSHRTSDPRRQVPGTSRPTHQPWPRRIPAQTVKLSAQVPEHLRTWTSGAVTRTRLVASHGTA